MSDVEISQLFVRDGKYRFSRWSKPISPVVFGVDDSSLIAIKATFSSVISLTPLYLSDLDPDLGANLLVFFCSDWIELKTIPNLNKLIPNLATLVATLAENGANQYRSFAFTAAIFCISANSCYKPNASINFTLVARRF